MKNIIILSLLLLSLQASAREPLDKPNIIFILIDDLGKEWLSCYGGEGIKTPQIDKLAKDGMRFENAYSMPQCTPSRACFMTGQYPFNNGWVNHWDSPRWGAGYFDWKHNPSIARMMKAAGYKTAVAGKWQLNDFRLQPDAMNKHGFDEYCMWTGAEGSTDKNHTTLSTQRYWDPYIHTKEGSKVYKGQFGPDIYNQFLLDFMSENKEQPFFIYYPMALTHSPFVHTPLEPEVKSKMDKHKAMVRYTDHLLGQVTDHLDELGIRKNTIIIWTCDNGTSGGITNNRNGRKVRGGKAKTTENGVNTPFIVNAPGLVPAGAVSKALVDFTDMYKTFAELAQAPLEKDYHFDGYSAKDVFLGNSKTGQREWIISLGSKPAVLTDKGVENVYYFRDRVIREKRFKLFVDSKRQVVKLIDVINDLEEKNDLSKKPEYQEILEKLLKVVHTLPKKDQDPKYDTLPKNDWDLKAKKKSQSHKRDPAE